MSKYAKKIVIRVFRENSWSENRVFMATITPRKKRHAIINQEINTETNQMKDWTRKRKIDFIITDNKSDLELCKLSKEIVIVTKKKNILFWQKQNINISKIIEVN